MNRKLNIDKYWSCDDFLKIIFLGLFDIGFGFDFSGGQNLSFLGTSGFLDLSFQLFLWFSWGVFLGENAGLSESVVGFILNHSLLSFVSEAESAGSVSTESSLESEQDDVLDFPSKLLGDEFLELGLGYVGLAFVINVEK